MQIINNVFLDNEVKFIEEQCKLQSWSTQKSIIDTAGVNFWKKNLINSELREFFSLKISKSIKRKIIINELYKNGQSFGQCGFWHVDLVFDNDFTLVYFPQEWLPEYGGHLLIKDNNSILSVLPEFNKAIIFNSSLEHMALGPSRHCNILRESIACKFKVYE